ncbi:kinase-like domain-containing protein [Rhizophagus irregularis DAOM 181602=DAOM 197198]|uniref:Kinase-like domain-containing protein n=1 Tax=Rhizophagus irregularis (strain DAOM 181602 / DAOM 197198 / MUCL 43194) TaxID=747089 RepID=A0A2P4PIG2_RHIID|nr:kinase-like domain-containing protein [Rhizophagus irregularis DAOM 181602=DAOM 197198]POG65182.1 kinase-like domain-containing protein [Rhizophagus irregularis DAOM 181602=DAOM 197198]|eukprot:XP_025172048.1 kinase-like domain-containing protein [Rhizophagus irregularis DAOM 181602=DAOM 197198]
MELSKMNSKENNRNLWKDVDYDEYQCHVTISTIGSTTESAEEIDDIIVYMEDLEKRKQAYGICGECNEPGTGEDWCQPCNAKRFKNNFKNWTSGNKDIDEFIQQSQLNTVHYTKYIEWIPFENFKDITYITRGGFGKIHSAEWPEGYIYSWDIENQKWDRISKKVALKSLDNSSCISTEFLNEIKTHLQIYLCDVIQCYGITQDPNTKDYMMILEYCKDGNLRNYYLNNESDYYSKISKLHQITRGLLDIHNSGKVHKDFHSGNILHSYRPLISDLGMCQPANNEKQSVKQEGIYGVLPYMAPEVLRGYQYTKTSDIYSFGIMMNEFISEETPYNNIPHNHALSIKIYLITKCWDAKAENRPTAKELYQTLYKCGNEEFDDIDTESQVDKDSDAKPQVEEYNDKIKLNRTSEKRANNIQTHPQAIYTSRLLNFKNLPEPVNSGSECFDCQLDELDLNESDQEEENNTE